MTEVTEQEPGIGPEMLLLAPLQIGLGEGRVSIHLFKWKDCNGLIFKDTGATHEVGSGVGEIDEELHTPIPGEVYISCANRESAVVLRDMVDKVVKAFGVEVK